jgi:hypothetical protein
MKKVFFSSKLARLPMSHECEIARRTPHRQSILHRLSASSRNIFHASCMVHSSAAVCSRRSWDLFQEKYRSLSEDRYRLGCAAPRPTVRFRLQNSRIPDLF